jgi:hypothetical protein
MVCLVMSIVGDRPLARRFVLPTRTQPQGVSHPLCALALILGACSLVPHDTLANASPMATTMFDTEASATPGYDAAPIAVISQATAVELTDEAAPGYPGVYYDGQTDWVPAQYLSPRVRPGIDTGVTVADTSLLDAPAPDASVPDIILEGQAVLVTKASVDGYDAAAHDGTGSSITKRDLL